MSTLKNIQNFYFIGIGGIGMSALAFYFKTNGYNVAGYDKTPSDVTSALAKEKIDIHFEDRGTDVKEDFTDTKNTLVVYTPAVPDSFGELVHFRESGYMIKKRAEVLGMIANEKFCAAVAGTHGKTTTSSILGHLLAETGIGVTAFIGGFTNNYNGNLIQKGNDVIVVEADEFDRSFLQLKPNVACITSMDADHLDIYGDASELEKTFKAFGNLVPSEKLFIKNGLPLEGNTVGVNDNASYRAQNIRIDRGAYIFDFKYPNGLLKELIFNLPGWHNLSNAVTALGMAIACGSPTECLPKALRTYQGVNRRFTYRIRTESCVLIDDYAHHPTEIDAIHQSVTEMYPDEKVLVVFQPHLYSRTQDFMDDFAMQLSQFDEVLLLDIYPARELPISGVSSSELLKKITTKRKLLVSKDDLPEMIKNASQKIVVMLGAGDIGVEIIKVTNYLKRAS